MELISHHQPVQQRSKGDTTCQTTSQNPSHGHPTWLTNVCTTRKDSESEWLAKDNPEINPITINPQTANHVAEWFSWVPLSYCSLNRRPSPVTSRALSACTSPWTIHLRVLDNSSLGPWKGSPFLQLIHVYVWLSSFAVYLKLSQHYQSAILHHKIKTQKEKIFWSPLLQSTTLGSSKSHSTVIPASSSQ